MHCQRFYTISISEIGPEFQAFQQKSEQGTQVWKFKLDEQQKAEDKFPSLKTEITSQVSK